LYPLKSIKSRYSITSASSTFFGIKNSGITNSYIYAPYIIMEETPIIIDGMYKIRKLRNERKQKLEKIWQL
jgi:hypothetical protein